MEQQKKYEPLVEKILERLELERQDERARGLSAKYDLEVPRVQDMRVQDTRVQRPTTGDAQPDQFEQVVESSHFYPDVEELADLASKPALEALDTQAYRQDNGISVQLPAAVPLAQQNFQAPAATQMLDGPLNLAAHAVEEDSDFDTMAKLEDELPALFHRQPQKAAARPKNVRSIVFGLGSATLLGAFLVFLMSPDHRQSSGKTTSAQGFASPDKAEFASGNSIISAKDYLLQTEEGKGLFPDDAAPLPSAMVDLKNLPDKPTTPSTPPISGLLASINGPLESLLQNVVKDLSDSPTPNDGASVVSTAPLAPIPGAEATLDQLENSLENIVSPSSGSLASASKTFVVAQKQPDPAAKTGGKDKMQALTNQVVDALSDLGGSTSSEAAPLDRSVDRLRSSLSALVQEAESQGKSAGSVKLLLKEALGDNQKNLPAALKNADGSLDITSLIASVVKNADGKSGKSGADANYLSMIEDEGKNTALTARLFENKGGKRYLTVKPGDTLSSIAYATYGDSFQYPKIFKANKAILSNANALAIGMRLVIPK